MRNSKALLNEIKSFTEKVLSSCGRDSKEYQDCKYYLDILHEYYIGYSIDMVGRDILSDLKGLISKLGSKISDFQPGQIEKAYPSIAKMIATLDSELPKD